MIGSLLISLLVLAFRYIFTFAIGAGPVTGLIIPELSSAKMRGKIMGFSFSVHWVGTRSFFIIYSLEKGKEKFSQILLKVHVKISSI